MTRNRVPGRTAGGRQIDIDLRGRAHFDKASGKKIETPHVHQSKVNESQPSDNSSCFNGRHSFGAKTIGESKKMKARLLKDLQEWFAACCDGEWEHQHGIKIESLDNPGWSLEIDLREETLGRKTFDEVEISRSDTDWILCRVRNGRFEGFGGPLNLEELVEIFLQWVR